MQNTTRSGGWKKSKKSINVEGGFFFKISKRDFTFIREMRVLKKCLFPLDAYMFSCRT